jgi:putative transcriptional regulator
MKARFVAPSAASEVTIMKHDLFAELLTSTGEALEHARGKKSLKTTALPLPPKPMDARAVKRVRASLDVSQALFARYLNVSTKLVQAWEAGRRTPDGPALVLLHIAVTQPEIIAAARTSRTTRLRQTSRRGRRPANSRTSDVATG